MKIHLLALTVVLLTTSCVRSQVSSQADVKDWRKAKSNELEIILERDPRVRQFLSNDIRVAELRRQLKPLTIRNRKFLLAEGDLLLDEASFLIYARDRLGITNASAKGAPRLFGSLRPGSADICSTGVELDGKLVRWEKPALTYCVRQDTFANAAEYQMAVANMRAAVPAWEAACNITLSYQSKHDNGPTPIDENDGTPTPITFIVEGFDVGGAFIASAFFPHEPGYCRYLRLDPSYFKSTMNYDRVGVLRHELGHILGLRHEHIRSGAPPVCPSDLPVGHVFKLTDYDPKSVMHYFCGGEGTRELNLTEKDVLGVQVLYGPPLKKVLLSK